MYKFIIMTQKWEERKRESMSLSIKKKILISGISVGLTTTIAVAVSVPVLMNNHQQSSSINTPSANIASYPESDTFSLNLIAKNQDDLNSQLSNLFSNDVLSSSYASYFQKASDYKNVNVIFNENSGNIITKIFTLTITPKNNFKWDNGGDDAKLINVNLSNLSITSNNSILKNDSVESLDGIYKLNYSDLSSSVYDSKTLNSFLDSSFDKSKLGGTYSNVDIKYVVNSANFESSTFNIEITPSFGHSWSDGSTSSKIKEITINYSDAVKDSNYPTTDVLKTSVNIGNESISVNSLQTALKNILDNGSLFNGLVSKKLYKNVNLLLPSNASEDGKTFKLTIIPKAGHLWTDGSFEPKTITITIYNLVSNWDATLIVNDTFTGKLSYSNQSSFTSSIRGLIERQGNNFVKFLQNGNAYKNVNIAYAPGTPSFSTKTFKLYVSPILGHAWADNGTTGTRVVTVIVL